MLRRHGFAFACCLTFACSNDADDDGNATTTEDDGDTDTSHVDTDATDVSTATDDGDTEDTTDEPDPPDAGNGEEPNEPGTDVTTESDPEAATDDIDTDIGAGGSTSGDDPTDPVLTDPTDPGTDTAVSDETDPAVTDEPERESFTLRVTVTGDGVGTASAGGQSCADECEFEFPVGTEPRIQARPTNGEDSYFGGFSDDCEGIEPECTVLMDGPKHVTLEFLPQVHNLVFLSSVNPGNLVTSVTAYDDLCNEWATNAGINTAEGDGFVAWVSDDDSQAIDRLGTSARGWIRVDGKPVGDEMSELVAGQILNPIRVSEKGVYYDSGSVRTGMVPGGGPSEDNCNNYFSDASGYSVSTGSLAGGLHSWYASGELNCANSLKVYCFGNTHDSELAYSRSEGKLLFLSNDLFTPGPTTPDEACDSSRPAGTGLVRALITYPDEPAIDLIDPAANYVRPDGVFIATGEQLRQAAQLDYWLDGVYLDSGIWQTGDGRYPIDEYPSVWVGDAVITRAVGTGTCDSWTNPDDGSGKMANYDRTTLQFWDTYTAGTGSMSCTTPLRLYCIEE